MNISEHITYKEATFSATGIRKGINNDPDGVQLKNMMILACKVFEPLRAALGGRSIRISSFYRSPELNSLLGGAKSSQHTAQNGAAMDLDNESNPSNKEIFDYIRSNMEFDQLILEYPDQNDNPSWVHVSYTEGANRKQVLRCVNGHYINY